MANGRRRPIAPVRKLVAAVLGTCATFMVLFGLGLGSFAVAAFGVALLVLAIGVVLVTTARGGARAWIAGTAYVHTVTEPPASSVFGRCEMQIVIEAPGLPPRSVKVRDPRVPVAKWPRPGAALPIMVAIDDQRRVRIIWDDVLTHAEAAEFGDTRGGYDWPNPRADEVLVEPGAPPPKRPAADGDLSVPAEAGSTATDFGDDSGDDLGDDGDRQDEPVVVHRTPSGTIVVEGRLVDPPPVIPLPRRAGSGQHPDGGLARQPAVQPPGGADTADTAVHPAADTTIEVRSGTADTAAAPGEPDAEPDRTGVINGVGVTVLVTDLDRSLRFYRDTLGFSRIDGAEGNAVLASGGTRLVLRANGDVTPVKRRLVHLNLEVGDLDAVYAELQSKGVRFTYPPRAVNQGVKLELWAAAFRDPDGHGIALTQWRSRSTT